MAKILGVDLTEGKTFSEHVPEKYYCLVGGDSRL